MAEFKVFSKNDVARVEILMTDEIVQTEVGAVQYFLGNIQKQAHSLPVNRFFKAKFVSQKLPKPTYLGTGKLVLEPSLGEFHLLTLNNKTLFLERGVYFASEQNVEVSGHEYKEIPGFRRSENFMQTVVSGTGTVVLSIPGPVEMIELKNDRLVADGAFVVARTEGLTLELKKSSKPVMGNIAWGEGVESILEGTGCVYLAPIPNPRVLLEKAMIKGFLAVKNPKKFLGIKKSIF